MMEEMIVNLLSVQLAQPKLSYLEIGNLDSFIIFKLLKLNRIGFKCLDDNFESLTIWKTM